MMILLILGCAGTDGEERSRSCDIEEGEYEAWLPAGWNEKDPLPVVMYIHGYNGSPASVSNKEDVMAEFSDAGVLLLLPESHNGSWDVRLNSDSRDDLGFFDAILEAAEDCWGIDESRLYVTGFSIGGSMAHQLACYRGDVFAASAPLSGTFWDPMPTSCDVPPIPVRHTHGLSDTTWPYEGQEFSPGAIQGAAEDGVAVWRTHNNSTEATTTELEGDGALTCTVWGEGDAEVRLCTHEKGHTRIDGWAGRMIEWFYKFNL